MNADTAKPCPAAMDANPGGGVVPFRHVGVLSLTGTPRHLELGHALLQPLHTLLLLLQPLSHLNTEQQSNIVFNSLLL